MVVSFLQVYSDTPSDLSGAFVAIVVCSALFLWFEFQQFLKSPKRYILSPYNYLDISVYTVPLIVGILHIVEFSKAEVTSDISTRILSFAILIVYLHLVSFLYDVGFGNRRTKNQRGANLFVPQCSSSSCECSPVSATYPPSSSASSTGSRFSSLSLLLVLSPSRTRSSTCSMRKRPRPWPIVIHHQMLVNTLQALVRQFRQPTSLW